AHPSINCRAPVPGCPAGSHVDDRSPGAPAVQPPHDRTAKPGRTPATPARRSGEAEQLAHDLFAARDAVALVALALVLDPPRARIAGGAHDADAAGDVQPDGLPLLVEVVELGVYRPGVGGDALERPVAGLGGEIAEVDERAEVGAGDRLEDAHQVLRVLAQPPVVLDDH